MPVITSTDQHIVTMLEHLKEEMAVIKQMLLHLTQQSNTVATLPAGINLPLSSLAELEATEDKMKDLACFNGMTKYLSTIGGTDPCTNTRHVLSRILTMSWAQQLCWQGSGKKAAFADMQLCRAFVDAVLKSSRTTQTDIEAAIKRWLRNPSPTFGLGVGCPPGPHTLGPTRDHHFPADMGPIWAAHREPNF
ncbi:hypothetical protein MATL_G00264260 [Megalops atlanticus]|uniref:DUF4806 domain-containing protein n=1 Tax=Megalops atlanticus TaxID=7932 RepID=A0A9D3SYZ0_MEGAT|nr:hypothetical protein MATL_G00264260 [Megalops atlanticus]